MTMMMTKASRGYARNELCLHQRINHHRFSRQNNSLLFFFFNLMAQKNPLQANLIDFIKRFRFKNPKIQN